MADRGYSAPESDEKFKSMTPADFKTFMERIKGSIVDSMSGVYTRQSDPYNHGYGTDAYVQFMEWNVDSKTKRMKQTSKKSLHDLIARLQKEYKDLKHIIFVTIKGISPNSRSITEALPLYKFELFEYLQLSIIPGDHMLSSQLRLLTPSQVEAIRVKNNLNLEKLPKYGPTDVMVKYYGAQSGDVFEINNKPFLERSMLISNPISDLEYVVVLWIGFDLFWSITYRKGRKFTVLKYI